MEKLLLSQQVDAAISSFIPEKLRSPENLNAEMFKSVNEFYGIESIIYADDNATSAERDSIYRDNNKEKADEHLEKGQEIGRLMDMQFLQYLKENPNNEASGITTVLALRGSVGLEDPSNVVMQELQDYLPIGIKRNGPTAHIYFPENGMGEINVNNHYRIKDFGIATAATSIEIAKELIKKGVPAKNIIIQGAVGTKFAYEAIKAELPEVAVLFAVEGQMQIEAEYLAQNKGEFSTKAIVQLANNRRHHTPDGHTYESWWSVINQDYYLNAIRPNSPKEHFTSIDTYQKVNPKDWGDCMFTPMNNLDSVRPFIVKFMNLMVGKHNFANFNMEELRHYYEKKIKL